MLKPAELEQFTGTMQYYRMGPLFPKMLLTDGAQYVAENGGTNGAVWLMTAICSWQPMLRKNFGWAKQMQFWELVVNEDKSAVLSCREDSGRPDAVGQEIEYTDFDVSPFKLWVAPTHMGDDSFVIMLPSEY